MLLISRQSDYAARILLDLALQPPGTRATAREVAERRQIPQTLVRRIVAQLALAGLVKTARGRDGGIMLARRACDTSLFDVVQVMEGPAALNVCTAGPAAEPAATGCALANGCVVRDVWLAARYALADQLRAATFDLLALRAAALGDPVPVAADPTAAAHAAASTR